MSKFVKILSAIILLSVLFISCGESSSGENGEENNSTKDSGEVVSFQNDDKSVMAFVKYPRENVSIVETINITLEIHKRKNAVVIFPKEKDFELDRLIIHSTGSLKTSNDNDYEIISKQITLLPEELGEVFIKSIQIKYTLDDNVEQTLNTEAIKFNVISYTGKEPEEVQFEEKIQPEDIEFDYSTLIPWAIVVGTVLIMIIAILLILRVIKNRRGTNVKIEIPPHIEAMTKLDNLEKQELPEKGEIDEYHNKLSLILRRYIEKRFLIRAPEQTTEEFITEISSNDIIGYGNKMLLRDYMTQSDLIKFAKFVPPIDYHKESMKMARDFVKSTSPKVQNEETEIEKAQNKNIQNEGMQSEETQNDQSDTEKEVNEA